MYFKASRANQTSGMVDVLTYSWPTDMYSIRFGVVFLLVLVWWVFLGFFWFVVFLVVGGFFFGGGYCYLVCHSLFNGSFCFLLLGLF